MAKEWNGPQESVGRMASMTMGLLACIMTVLMIMSPLYQLLAPVLSEKHPLVLPAITILLLCLVLTLFVADIFRSGQEARDMGVRSGQPMLWRRYLPADPKHINGEDSASSSASDTKQALRTARFLLNVMKTRDEEFQRLMPVNLFGDPAWTMVLDLFVSGRAGKKVSVSSLCIASNAPSTTALRYISQMVENGIFIRTPDDSDGRRVYISLSQKAEEMVMSVLLG